MARSPPPTFAVNGEVGACSVCSLEGCIPSKVRHATRLSCMHAWLALPIWHVALSLFLALRITPGRGATTTPSPPHSLASWSAGQAIMCVGVWDLWVLLGCALTALTGHLPFRSPLNCMVWDLALPPPLADLRCCGSDQGVAGSSYARLTLLLTPSRHEPDRVRVTWFSAGRHAINGVRSEDVRPGRAQLGGLFGSCWSLGQQWCE